MSSVNDLVMDVVGHLPKSGTGFYAFNCPCCTDQRRRGGLKIDGTTIGYSCFNCPARGLYEEGDAKLSKTLRTVFQFLGVNENELKAVLSTYYFTSSEKKARPVTQITRAMNEVELPVGSVSISAPKTDEQRIWSEVMIEYLKSRKIEWTNYRFMISEELGYEWLIIPFYSRDRVVFWQARNVDDQSKDRFRSASTETGRAAGLMWNVDEIARHDSTPIFVLEGVFDAMSIGKNAVCTMSADLTEKQVTMLNSSSREKIVVIDRDKDGIRCGENALTHGWSVTYFDDRDCKDVNSFLCRHGYLRMVQQLMANRKTGVQAQLALNFMKQELKR